MYGHSYFYTAFFGGVQARLGGSIGVSRITFFTFFTLVIMNDGLLVRGRAKDLEMSITTVRE
jgi:hypothetical protein